MGNVIEKLKFSYIKLCTKSIRIPMCYADAKGGRNYLALLVLKGSM
jgi:hypothetical protein